MRYLGPALQLAFSRGYLPLQQNPFLWLRGSPNWLDALQNPDGMQQLAARLQVSIPISLREFWSEPALVRLLDSWRWQDFLDEEPRLIHWDSRPYIVVCTHPHSGGVGAVATDEGDDPRICWGWEEENTPMEPAKFKFSEFVYESIKNGPG